MKTNPKVREEVVETAGAPEVVEVVTGAIGAEVAVDLEVIVEVVAVDLEDEVVTAGEVEDEVATVEVAVEGEGRYIEFSLYIYYFPDKFSCKFIISYT